MSSAVSETITKEGGLLLLSFGFGILLMLFYDVLRIFRQLVAHGAILMSAEDIIYWLCCSLLAFAMLYRENDGLLRWFVLAGMALGMIVENSFLSPYIVKLFSFLLSKIFGILSKAIKIFTGPFRAAGKRGKKFYFLIQKQLKKMGKAIKIGIRKF